MTPLEIAWRERLGIQNFEDLDFSFYFKMGDIDKGILPLIKLLRADGFQTVGCCEGGEGCCSGRPYIQMLPDLGSTPIATFERLEKWFPDKGIESFELNLQKSFNIHASLKSVRSGWDNFLSIPFIFVWFPQFELPPFHENEFSHKQYPNVLKRAGLNEGV